MTGLFYIKLFFLLLLLLKIWVIYLAPDLIFEKSSNQLWNEEQEKCLPNLNSLLR